MSQIQVDNIYNKEATGGPNFPLGANVTGVVTATTFKGGAEITSGTISATSVTAASGTFNGPVTIGGTLTYEDVTNIDSVGVITARNGVKVSAGGVDVTAGGLDIAGGGINAVGVVTATNDIKANGNIIGDNSTNISGVSSVTATTYYGSGASLTGIDAAPSLKLNASGSIAAGKPTIVNTDGTVSEVKQTIAGIETPTYTGQNNIANPADYPVGVQIPGTDTMLMAYQYGSGANAGYARVMTRSATTLTQTSNAVSYTHLTLPTICSV